MGEGRNSYSKTDPDATFMRRMERFRQARYKEVVADARITTERGIHLRVCRSIQVEGAFGLLKNDFGFRRFLTKGKVNIRGEHLLAGMPE